MNLDQIRNVLSPAKLNLFLHVTGRREDGYHLLQSVFVAIDWFDIMHFKVRHDGQIMRHDLSPVELPQNDLSVQAAKKLQEITGTSLGADIYLEKNVPMQAGLGGGSSNAASTLLALNKLWGLKLQRQELQSIAQQLGSDVPFFLHQGPAWIEGVGEKILPIDLPKPFFEATLAVLKPEHGVTTQQIFSSPLLTRNTKPVKISDFISAAEHKDTVFSFGRNDLQQAASDAEPQIAQAIEWLEHNGARNTRMTGSGSAVFGIIDTLYWSNNIPQLGWKLKLCRILDSHPHVQWSAIEK